MKNTVSCYNLYQMSENLVFCVFRVFWKLMPCATLKWSSCGGKGMARGGRRRLNHCFYSKREEVSCRIVLLFLGQTFSKFTNIGSSKPKIWIISVRNNWTVCPQFPGKGNFCWCEMLLPSLECFPDSCSLVRSVLELHFLLCAGPLGRRRDPARLNTKLWAHLRWMAHSLGFPDYSISVIQSGIAWASEIDDARMWYSLTPLARLGNLIGRLSWELGREKA